MSFYSSPIGIRYMGSSLRGKLRYLFTRLSLNAPTVTVLISPLLVSDNSAALVVYVGLASCGGDTNKHTTAKLIFLFLPPPLQSLSQ